MSEKKLNKKKKYVFNWLSRVYDISNPNRHNSNEDRKQNSIAHLRCIINIVADTETIYNMINFNAINMFLFLPSETSATVFYVCGLLWKFHVTLVYFEKKQQRQRICCFYVVFVDYSISVVLMIFVTNMLSSETYLLY